MRTAAIILTLFPLMASASTLTVNSARDTVAAGDGACTLREAIANVNAAADTTGGDCAAGTGSGDTITFSGRSAIALALGELLIQRDVTITGAPTTVAIGGGHETRVFEIVAGTATMANLTIQNGIADQGGAILVDSGAFLALNNCTLRNNGTTVAGGGLYNDGGTVSLSNCKLIGNKASNLAGDGRGGAIYNSHGTVTLEMCTFSRNTAFGSNGGSGFGGAIQNGDAGGSDATLEATGSTFSLNQAKMPTGSPLAGGGGIENFGTADLTDCSFTSNSARSGNGGSVENFGTATLINCTFTRSQARYGNGGAVENEGQVTLGDSLFKGNLAWAGSGGGVDNGSVATVTSCLFDGNRAGVNGGGVNNTGTATVANTTITGSRAGINGGGVRNDYNINIRDSTISGNVAGANAGTGFAEGGGVDNRETVTFSNCTLTGNRSFGGGSAVDSFNENHTAEATLINCTVVGNQANARLNGGGGALDGSFDYRSTIIADNVGGESPNCGIHGTSYGHNLGDIACFFDPMPTDLLNIDPRLAPLADNGGPTETMALCTGVGVPDPSCTGASPAIDAGDDSVTGPPDNLTTDQRGLPRLSGAHVDIGAYELQQ